MTLAVTLLLGLTVGFALGALLAVWASRPDHQPLPPFPGPPQPRQTPATVVDLYRPVSHAIASQIYLAGVRDGVGQAISPESVPDHLHIGREPIAQGTRNLATVAGHAYAHGVTELRDALAKHTGIDDLVLLDQAVEIAFTRKTEQHEHSAAVPQKDS